MSVFENLRIKKLLKSENIIKYISDNCEDENKIKVTESNSGVKYSHNTYEEPNPNIRFSKKVPNVAAIDSFEPNDTFSTAIIKKLDTNHIDYIEFYKRAHLERKLFSAIKTNNYYQPSFNTAIKCCLGLRLNIHETEELLKTASYQLSMSKYFDLIIRYCIENQIYDIDLINEVLFKFTKTTL